LYAPIDKAFDTHQAIFKSKPKVFKLSGGGEKFVLWVPLHGAPDNGSILHSPNPGMGALPAIQIPPVKKHHFISSDRANKETHRQKKRQKPKGKPERHRRS
jgi:hypothetical protein